MKCEVEKRSRKAIKLYVLDSTDGGTQAGGNRINFDFNQNRAQGQRSRTLSSMGRVAQRLRPSILSRRGEVLSGRSTASGATYTSERVRATYVLHPAEHPPTGSFAEPAKPPFAFLKRPKPSTVCFFLLPYCRD